MCRSLIRNFFQTGQRGCKSTVGNQFTIPMRRFSRNSASIDVTNYRPTPYFAKIGQETWTIRVEIILNITLIMAELKQLENVENFTYLCSKMTNVTRCAGEIIIQGCHGKSCVKQEEGSIHL